MPVPIVDLRLDTDGVYGTLSFQRTPFVCAVPWKAIFAVRGQDGNGVVWSDDLPDELRFLEVDEPCEPTHVSSVNPNEVSNVVYIDDMRSAALPEEETVRAKVRVKAASALRAPRSLPTYLRLVK